MIPQPYGGAVTAWETLQFIADANDISAVFLLGGNSGGSPSDFAQFDCLTYEVDTQQIARGKSVFLLLNGPPGGTIPVPEPGSLLLVAAALLASSSGCQQVRASGRADNRRESVICRSELKCDPPLWRGFSFLGLSRASGAEPYDLG